MKQRILASALMIALCFSFAVVQKKVKTEAKFWVGVTYAMSKQHKHSDETIAAVGVFGVAHAVVEGAVWGTVGGPAGMIAGAAAGL